MTRSGHIALAGAPNVGKSSLLNALVGTHLAIVSPKAQATRLPVVGLRTEGDTQFVFHDLPGLLEPGYLLQARMRELALERLGAMDLILHLHPAPDAPAPPFVELAGPVPAPVGAGAHGLHQVRPRLAGAPRGARPRGPDRLRHDRRRHGGIAGADPGASARGRVPLRPGRCRHPAAPLLRRRVPARGGVRAAGRRGAVQLQRRSGGVSRG